MRTLGWKVPFITWAAARGQGRSHAVCLGEEGAGIIGIGQGETERLVAATGRRTVSREGGDMRELHRRRQVAVDGVGQPGRLNAAAASAGARCGKYDEAHAERTFRNQVDANLIGAWRMAEAGRPVRVAEPAGAGILG